MNLVPAQYREVSVAEVPVPLEEGALRGYLAGRDVYRRTRYVIARNGAVAFRHAGELDWTSTGSRRKVEALLAE